MATSEGTVRIILNPSLVDNHHRDEYPITHGFSISDFLRENVEHKSNVFLERSPNGLLNAFLLAYNNHLDLKLRPDDLHIAIQNIFSTYVNIRPEELRHIFVDHEDKKELVVELDPNFTINDISEKMTELLSQNVKNPELLAVLKPTYSTTTPLITTVSGLTVMNTLKSYFSYGMILGCGIPAVHLAGSVEDWRTLLAKYRVIADLILRTETMARNSDNGNILAWLKRMDQIMNMFLEMREFAGSQGSVQARPEWVEIWSRVISNIPYGSGGDTQLGGWVAVLIPFSKGLSMILDFENLPCFDMEREVPRKTNNFDDEGIQSKFFGLITYDSIQDSIFYTPIKAYDTDKILLNEYDLLSGFSRAVWINPKMQVECNMVVGLADKDDNGKKAQRRWQEEETQRRDDVELAMEKYRDDKERLGLTVASGLCKKKIDEIEEKARRGGYKVRGERLISVEEEAQLSAITRKVNRIEKVDKIAKAERMRKRMSEAKGESMGRGGKEEEEVEKKEVEKKEENVVKSFFSWLLSKFK